MENIWNTSDIMAKKFIQLTTKITLETRDMLKRFFPPETPDYQILRKIIEHFIESKEKEARISEDRKIFEDIKSISERFKKQDEEERLFEERMERMKVRPAFENREEALESDKEKGNSVTTTGNTTTPESKDQAATGSPDNRKNNQKND
jgi:hypothetical protein